MDWRETLAKLTPVVASAFLGPLSGSVIAAVGSILGIGEPTVESIGRAIEDGKLTGEHIAAIRELELKLKAEEDERGFRYADLEFRNVQGARDRDDGITKSGRHNWRADIMFVLAVTVICWLVYVIWKDPTINEYMKGIVTLVLGRFLGYLDNIYNFEFGTTRGSQNKDSTISTLVSK